MDEPTTRADPPPDRVAALWRRAKEHRVAQWTVGYVAVAYGIQHAVILTSDSYEWPNVVARVSMTLLALGLPIAMTLAWYHGDSANRRVSGAELSILATLLLGVSMLFYVLVTPAGEAPKLQPETRPVQTANGISLAVLPFVNLSGDASQEFFSDGMTEEITAALAQVPGLKVRGRTSAFQYKGQNKDLRVIGQELGASHLIEGSVRKQGNRLRITAQLVKADDDTHVWAQNYDRDQTDVFAIQEDIAQAIAAALKAPLGLARGETLVRDRTTNAESYQQYLQAKFFLRNEAPDRAAAIMEALVARDPSYAPAWAMLAKAYTLINSYMPAYRSGTVEEARQILQPLKSKADAAARKAIALDPRSAWSYAVLASNAYIAGKWQDAEGLYRSALAVDASDADILASYRFFLATSGRVKDAVRVSQQVQSLEPFVPLFTVHTAEMMLINGQIQAAIPILEGAPDDPALSYSRDSDLARVYAAVGQFGKAADALLRIRGNQVSRESVEDAARIIRGAPQSARDPAALPAIDGSLNFVYAYVGARERLLERAERNLQVGSTGTNYWLWDPIYAPLRKTERFKAIIRKMGLVDYWKVRGWPDLCHPAGTDDFVCE